MAIIRLSTCLTVNLRRSRHWTSKPCSSFKLNIGRNSHHQFTIQRSPSKTIIWSRTPTLRTIMFIQIRSIAHSLRRSTRPESSISRTSENRSTHTPAWTIHASNRYRNHPRIFPTLGRLSGLNLKVTNVVRVSSQKLISHSSTTLIRSTSWKITRLVGLWTGNAWLIAQLRSQLSMSVQKTPMISWRPLRSKHREWSQDPLLSLISVEPLLEMTSFWIRAMLSSTCNWRTRRRIGKSKSRRARRRGPATRANIEIRS